MPDDEEKPDGAAVKEDIEEKPADDKADGEKKGKAAPKGKAKASPRGGKSNGAGKDPLDDVMQMMQDQEFGKAVTALEKMLKKEPEDPILLHNLGVVLTELERFAEAEDIFNKAFDAQKKVGKYNYATLFGLATVLTEQGQQDMGKLLQAEALFRDCLIRAIEQEEKGVFETYRNFSSLAENLALQKRWGDARECWEQSLELGVRMFGEDHERNKAQRAMLARAKKLARIQRVFRVGLWTATAAVPIFCAYAWYVGGPSLREMFPFFFSPNTTTALQAEGPPSVSAEL